MRAVVQRVIAASVHVDGVRVAEIARGLLVYLAIGRDDEQRAESYVVDKLVGLRAFADENGKMNVTVREAGGAVLIVPQFTLYGDVRSGRRPGFAAAMAPDAARVQYDHFVTAMRRTGLAVATGLFGADMQVRSQVDGPITLLLDSSRLF